MLSWAQKDRSKKEQFSAFLHKILTTWMLTTTTRMFTGRKAMIS